LADETFGLAWSVEAFSNLSRTRYPFDRPSIAVIDVGSRHLPQIKMKKPRACHPRLPDLASHRASTSVER
jgi:hypothetical protein